MVLYAKCESEKLKWLLEQSMEANSGPPWVPEFPGRYLDKKLR